MTAFDADFWEEHWHGHAGGAMASGPPNPHLVREIGPLTPGTALDVGCGAGAEAIWLAAQGWQVTGVDIATRALEHAVERVPEEVAARVAWVRADASTWEPERRFDLVTTHYAHPAIPQVEFYARLGAWVAPAGSLLVVGHGHAHGGAHASGAGSDASPPPEASVTAAAVRSCFDPPTWEVAVAEEVRRDVTGPGGRATVLDDVVVRVVRRG